MLLALGVLGTVSTADAAAPAGGTVGDTARTVGWTGGPLLVANQTGNVGDPVCTPAGDCDDFALSVDVPAGYGDTHDLRVSVTWDDAVADLDLYLLDAAGAVVATAASSDDPEVLTVPAPAAGTYTVRVVPFTPLTTSYDASATLVDAAPSTGDGTGGSTGGGAAGEATFTDYAAPSAFPDANDAGEPSIGNSFLTGATMYQAGLSTFKTTFDDATAPAGVTWTDVSADVASGCPQGSTTSLDPILFTDRATGRTFESQLTGVDSFTCYTDDDGETWSPSTGGGIPSGVDHQTLGGGPLSAADPLAAANAVSGYDAAVYYCSQSIAAAFCAASHDGGSTFGDGVPTYSLLDCGGLHGHVKVAPDGTAYLPNKGCGDTQAVVVSEDGGTSWEVRPVPGTTPRRLRPVGRHRPRRHRVLRLRRRRQPPRHGGQRRQGPDLARRAARGWCLRHPERRVPDRGRR